MDEQSLSKADQTKQLTSSKISERAIKIALVIVDVNKLLPVPLNGSELSRWAQDIERLAPGATTEMLSFIMDCFKVESLIWDRNKGIQNIFNALKMIKVTDSGIKLLKPIY